MRVVDLVVDHKLVCVGLHHLPVVSEDLDLGGRGADVAEALAGGVGRYNGRLVTAGGKE
jgi:hypothetical protein